jgi:hypothetical protein
MISTHLLDEHPRCLSSRSLVQAQVPNMHQILLLVLGGSYKDISFYAVTRDKQHFITLA